MLYNILKFLHILSVSVLIGTEVNYQYNKKCNFILLISSITIIITGIGMMHIAMFSFEDLWIYASLISLAIYVLSILHAIFIKDYKLLRYLRVILILIALGFMVTKFELG